MALELCSSRAARMSNRWAICSLLSCGAVSADQGAPRSRRWLRPIALSSRSCCCCCAARCAHAASLRCCCVGCRLAPGASCCGGDCCDEGCGHEHGHDDQHGHGHHTHEHGHHDHDTNYIPVQHYVKHAHHDADVVANHVAHLDHADVDPDGRLL